jgi:hypothetical protein
MATNRNRNVEQVQRDIEAERERLAVAVDDLRGGIDRVASLKGKLLPAASAVAFGLGFVAAGGVGATMRLLTGRGRESRAKARFGPFSFVDRD